MISLENEMGFTLAGVLTALFFVAAAAHDDFLHGCSSHCQLNDADLTCWNRTNEFFERVTLSLMRQYVHVQVQRAQFMKKQKVKPDFKEMGDETIYRWSGEKPSNIEDEDGMTNKRLYTEIARSLLEAVKENVDKPDLKHNLMCPQGCEHSSRHWMWMFIGSAIVTCIITSLLVTVVCLLDRRDKRMSMLEEASASASSSESRLQCSSTASASESRPKSCPCPTPERPFGLENREDELKSTDSEEVTVSEQVQSIVEVATDIPSVLEEEDAQSIAEAAPEISSVAEEATTILEEDATQMDTSITASYISISAAASEYSCSHVSEVEDMFSSWFHKKEPANPSEIAKMIRSAADNTDNKKMKAALQAAKTLMQDATEEDSKEVAVMGLEIARSLPPLDADKLKKLDFDNKKGVKDLFCGLLRQPATLSSMVERLGDPENMALVDIMKGYAREDIAVLCGQMLRECIHYEALAKKLLCSEDFYDLFRYAEDTHFDIAADALSTLRVLLTKHKKMVCEFLHNNKDFFTSYERLLSSESYIARRQSVKLLGEILLDHHNFTVMKQYIEKPDNLKIAMNLLRKKDSIAFEAFHVFKVFVANSDRPPQIDHILRCNKERLVKFLDGFCDDSRPEDEQFKSEKSFLIQQIQNIQEDAA